MLRGEPNFSKAQKDKAKNQALVFLRLEARVRAELVGGIPETLFQRRSGGVFLGRSYPEHEVTISILGLCELERVGRAMVQATL